MNWPRSTREPVALRNWNASSSAGSQYLNWKTVMCHSALWCCTASLLELLCWCEETFLFPVWQFAATDVSYACTSACSALLLVIPVTHGLCVLLYHYSLHNLCCAHLLLLKNLDTLLCRVCWTAQRDTEHNGIYEAVMQHYWSRLCLGVFALLFSLLSGILGCTQLASAETDVGEQT